MRYLKAFAHFWVDFIVGDDWVVAAGTIVAVAVTHGLVGHGIPAWWTMPAAVVVLLALSVWRATRR